MNKISEIKVIEFIKKHPNCSFIELAKGLKIPFNQNQDLTNLLNNLEQQFKIVCDVRTRNFYALEKLETFEGTISFASEGRFAFVDRDAEIRNPEESIFIPKTYFNGALNSDRVIVDVYKNLDAEGKLFGIVKQVIERKVKEISGTLSVFKNNLIFKPIKQLYSAFRFKIVDKIEEAHVDDIVIATIVKQHKELLEVKITKRLSNKNDPMAYVNTLLYERQIPEKFSEEVIEASNLIPDEIDQEGQKERLDLRNELIVTIDGDDTKDFDDAISVSKNQNGTYQLGVHIADVSYYVKEGDAIDNEALKRGTSIYLVDRVVPMLPEKLSNGICSLNPRVDRFTLSAIMTIDQNGKTLKTELYPSIIQSKYRLTYHRVNEFINHHHKFEDSKLNDMLTLAYELSQKVRAVKEGEGYLEFNVPEPKIILDERGNVVDISTRKTGISENMIEDFMVRTNEEVAKYMSERNVPVMFRVHEYPDEVKVENFNNVMTSIGISHRLNVDTITPKNFQDVVKNIQSQRDDAFLNMVYLRTMQKAIYSPENIGHFGLASECYCHFTSPIRRYPDLMVHRVLRDVIFNNNPDKIEHYDAILSEYAKSNSESEQFAVQVERDVNDLKFAEYYKNKIGQKLSGQIISILKFGMFVQFANNTEALVRTATMTDAKYEVNETLTKMISDKNTYNLGQNVEVIIVSADSTSGKVDAVLVNNYEEYQRELNSKSKGNHETKRKNS